MSNKINNTKLSKYLSYLLRHCEKPLGLERDSIGGVDLLELVQAINAADEYDAGVNVDVEDILEVVATNNKSRFALYCSDTRIRACQGHTVEIDDAAFSEAVPPPQLFHGTSIHALESISCTGSITKQKRHHVHLSADAATAYRVGFRHRKKGAYIEAVVLGIDTRKMAEAGTRFYLSENGVWLCAQVPFDQVNDIQVFRKGKSRHVTLSEARGMELSAPVYGHSLSDTVNGFTKQQRDLQVHTTMAQNDNVGANVTEDNVVQVLDAKISDLIDILAAFPKEAKTLDPKAWDCLLAYAPLPQLQAAVEQLRTRR